MKIVLATKGFPFFENLSERKDYISIENGIVKDDEITMLKNQEEYMKNFFTVDESKITDKTNISASDNFIREIMGIGINNYPENMYPKNFQFWNNVNYVKIIDEDGSVEYCYIKKRKCLNITQTSGSWIFTLQVDIWNTYWIKLYCWIMKNINLTLYIERWHEDRFKVIEYNKKKYLIFKFLSTQDTAFWNKENFESIIINNIPVISGTTINFYEDEEQGNKFVNEAFGKINNNYFLWQPKNSSGFYTFLYLPTNELVGSPFAQLNNFYGEVNMYYYLPVMNDWIMKFDNNHYFLDIEKFSRFYVLWFNQNNYHTTLNIVFEMIKVPLGIGIIYTPKPICLPMFIEDYGAFKPYVIRNITKKVDYNDWTFKGYKTVPENNIGGVALSDIGDEKIPDRLLRESPIYNNDNSRLNALCDERISLSDYFIKLFLIEIDNFYIDMATNINLEPKIFDENLFNLSYSHYNNDILQISPKWYFYQNIDDLAINKSIYIKGYQFVSPSYVKLIQYLFSGLYKEFNKEVLNNYISIDFSPWINLNKDKVADFLISNAVQMNTSLNSKARNVLVKATTGMASGVVVGKVLPVAGSSAGALVGATIGAVKGVMDIYNTKQSQEALLQDLANSPTSNQDNSSSNTFKFLPSQQGNWILNWINDIDKKKIWIFHAQNGYFLGKALTINPSNDIDGINTFASRIYYNHWKFSKLKLAINELNLANEYKEYFENLFENGITLFHEKLIINDVVINIQVGDYTKENWEISLYEYLKKINEINHETL